MFSLVFNAGQNFQRSAMNGTVLKIVLYSKQSQKHSYMTALFYHPSRRNHHSE